MGCEEGGLGVLLAVCDSGTYSVAVSAGLGIHRPVYRGFAPM